MNEFQLLTLLLAVLAFASWIATIIALRRHHRLAPVLCILSGVIGLAFLSLVPALFITGTLLSMMAIALGAALFFSSRRVAPRRAALVASRPPLQRQPREEPLSESGVWRLRHS